MGTPAGRHGLTPLGRAHLLLLAGLFGSVLPTAGGVAAQEADADEFEARILLVADASWAYFANGTQYDPRHHLAIEVGLARQYHPLAAIGVVLRHARPFELDRSDDSWWSLEGRFGRTLNGPWIVDVGLGPLHNDHGHLGWATHLGLSWNNRVHVFNHVDIAGETAWFMGAGGSGRLGVAAAGIVLLFRAFLAFGDDDGVNQSTGGVPGMAVPGG